MPTLTIFRVEKSDDLPKVGNHRAESRAKLKGSILTALSHMLTTWSTCVLKSTSSHKTGRKLTREGPCRLPGAAVGNMTAWVSQPQSLRESPEMAEFIA